MNIFKDKSGVLGEATVSHLDRSLTEFFQQAHEIRSKLNKQAYLLDKYLSLLFEAANATNTLNAASEGFENSGAELNGICHEILNCGPKYKEHSFFEQAKAYIDTHPLLYQEKHTKISAYCSLLASDFLRSAAEQYTENLEGAYGTVTDICELRDLYRQICSLLNGEEAMERLNLLFRQRFLIAAAMTIYLQCLTNQLIYSLTYRDKETSKQVFQLLLDEQLFPVEDRFQY